MPNKSLWNYVSSKKKKRVCEINHEGIVDLGVAKGILIS